MKYTYLLYYPDDDALKRCAVHAHAFSNHSDLDHLSLGYFVNYRILQHLSEKEVFCNTTHVFRNFYVWSYTRGGGKSSIFLGENFCPPPCTFDRYCVAQHE